MQLTFDKSIATFQNGSVAPLAMTWSDDSKKLVAAYVDRQLYFYNENGDRTEKISTRGYDHTKPSKDYVPTCVSFAKDPQFMAVGQSDNVVYIFNIGKNFESKAIKQRFTTTSPVTAIQWMSNDETAQGSEIVVGCADGTVYLCNMQRKSSQVVCSFQCMTQLLQQKQVNCDGQTQNNGSPVINIHKVSNTTCVIVNENGISAFFDVTSPTTLRMVSRQQATITASCLMFTKVAPVKCFLVLCSGQHIQVNAVETGQGLAQVVLKGLPQYITAAAGNPSGNGCILCSSNGIFYVTISSVNPLVLTHEPQSSLDIQAQTNGPNCAISCVAWKPDSSSLCVGSSMGAIDLLLPSLSSKMYCGAEVTNTAPNKISIKLKGFNSKSQNAPPGTLELYSLKSSEIKKIRAFPRDKFAECVKTGNFSTSGLYLVGVGDRSLVVYSFDTDLISELEVTMNSSDRLYFDVGVKRVMVVGNLQLGEFSVIHLPATSNVSPMIYSTIHQCCMASASVISCLPQTTEHGKYMLVAHLGEDRQEFVLTELSPPEEADDFTEPMTVLQKIKHGRIIDWLDISPNGKFVLIRDVSGAILIYVLETQKMIDLSPSLGNGVVLWASPFDVLVAQEQPDGPVIVYYDPGDLDDKPQLLLTPQDDAGWTLTRVDASQVDLSGQRTTATVYAVVVRHDGSRQLTLQLDSDLLFFNMLLTKKQVTGACILLSKANSTNRTQWMRLCAAALEQQQFMVCSRCYAALGDLGQSKYARVVSQRIKKDKAKFESEYQLQTFCRAQVAILQGNLEMYERYLQQCGMIDEAVQVYRELHLHQRAELICSDAEREAIHQESIDWLISTKQSTLAAQLKASRGDYRGALELLMNDRAYLSAYELVNKVQQVDAQALSEHAIEQLAGNLESAGHFVQSAALVSRPPLKDHMRALALYRRGGAYAEAIALARATVPNECVYIEKEWADSLATTGRYELAINHYIEAHETRKAVDCALKAGDFESAEKFLSSNQMEENNTDLCLRLGEAKFLAGEIDGAVKWFAQADQPLLALSGFTSVGRYEDGVNFAVHHFPGTNVADVILNEAQRLIGIEQKKVYQQPVAAGVVTPKTIIQKMESMSCVHGVLSARDLLAAAGMWDHAIQMLQKHQMWDELVAFARERKVNNLTDVLKTCSEHKRLKGDMRGCAQLLSELAYEFFKQASGSAGQIQVSANLQMKRSLAEAAKIFSELNMFEESMTLCKRCNDTEVLLGVALQWIQAQPSQIPNIIQMLIKLQRLEQTIVKATESRAFDIAMQLADHAANPELTKKDIWYRQGIIFESDGKLQEAEHAFHMSSRTSEALQMYVSHRKWIDAERVVSNMPMGQEKDQAIRLIKEGRARALVDEGKFKEAEQLYIEMDQIDEIVKQYKSRQMWQEALRLGRQFNRRDIITDISETFAQVDNDKLAKKKNDAQILVGMNNQAQTLNELHNKNEQERRDMAQLVAQQNKSAVPTSLRQRLIGAMRAGGEEFTTQMVARSLEIAQLVLAKNVNDEAISDDSIIMSQYINGFDKIPGNEEKAAMIAVNYLTKGLPQSLINENDKSKNMTCPMITAGINAKSLATIAKAILSLEFQEADYVDRVLKAELAHDGVFYKCRQLLLAYRTTIMSTQKGQQMYNSNKVLMIPGDNELSRIFEAVHLQVQLAHSMGAQGSLALFRERCQISSAVCRYCDLIPVDRAFAVAGIVCKTLYTKLLEDNTPQTVNIRNQFGGQAFVFLNRLMDIIELFGSNSKSTGELDATDIKNTGIPWDVSIPKVRYLTDKSINDIKAFVMGQAVQSEDFTQTLPNEDCPHSCGAQRWTGAVSCTKCKNVSPICCITGQHVINHHLKAIPNQPACSVCGCYARPSPWNQFVSRTKSCPVCGELGNPMGK